MNYTINLVSNKFYIVPTNASDIDKMMRYFKNKGTNINCTPFKIYKSIVNFISESISELFNQFIIEGKFPSCFKLARVIPIFKKNDRSDVSNYRPISTLPFLSKIFE